MPSSRLLSPAWALLVALAVAGGCKENGNDYLTEGLRLLGEAERGDCKPNVRGGQAMIDTTKVSQCLAKTKDALEQLHKARELGVDNKETNDLIAKTEAEVAKLESMLQIVGRMQHEP
ncbi:hypothetical protein ENSA5_25630 [Enhygromyxa salina]|uniref:Lipoprotein n=1 Tax=Enhygromyxa salina TaxID=215803 RepID=A0A2S9YAT6_9BACT|nr:hypothetical protein [Enhygromyxa salina]PRQ02228.1 hypothetical protein ENSA5_25630 [Enhygromyxa salina]